MPQLWAAISMLAMVIPLMATSPPGESETATIVNSGSTNRPGFRITIDRSGAAELTVSPRKFGLPGPERELPETIQRTLSRATVDRFFADLATARPFASLPPLHCMKSASFGSTMTVAFGGEQTPDLSCEDGGNAAIRDLIRDANEIVALLQAK
jgi:hypothetical protein